jgi:hypothetical protein
VRKLASAKNRKPVAEFVGFLALKLDLLLHAPWKNELTCIIYWSKGAPSMSHQTGQLHLRALAVQFAQLLHIVRRRPRWAVLKIWAIAEHMVFEVVVGLHPNSVGVSGSCSQQGMHSIRALSSSSFLRKSHDSTR